MVDDVILVSESGQTKLQAFSGTVGGNNVKAETIVLVQSSDLTPIATASQPLRVDPTGTTAQPVSNLQQWIGSVAPTVGQKTKANSLPVTIASDQAALGSVTITSGTVTANQGTPAAPSTPWPVQSSDGTLIEALQTDTLVTGTAGPAVRGYDLLAAGYAVLPLAGNGTNVPVSLVQSTATVPPGSSVLVSGAVSSGTISTNGGLFTFNLPSFSGIPAVTITGVFNGILIFEAADNLQNVWVQCAVKKMKTGQWITSVSANDTTNQYQFPNMVGCTSWRVRAISWTSGVASLTTTSSSIAQTHMLASGPPGYPVPPELLTLGATDPAGVLQPLQIDNSGNLKIKNLGISIELDPWAPQPLNARSSWGVGW